VADAIPILQARLPYTPWADPAMRRLPGIQGADPADAFASDEAYAGQMAERDRLIAGRPADVVAMRAEGRAAADELLDFGLSEAARRSGYAVDSASVTRPDGKIVPIDRGAPFATIGRLFQQDFCIMQKPQGGLEHVLTGAVLCFPAGWTLSEKIGRPLLRIHRPVPAYGEDLGRRVQRLFDALRPGRALWRANAHFSASPVLHTPALEEDPKPKRDASLPYLRSERQVLFRLPSSGAVVFSIHTIMVRTADLAAEQLETLTVEAAQE
jgi:dimethylamine monooxygenase subunit A